MIRKIIHIDEEKCNGCGYVWFHAASLGEFEQVPRGSH